MTRQDYIHQVDALQASSTLRGKIAALPQNDKGQPPVCGGHRKPLRWGTLVAALVLVVGLATAAPAIFRALSPAGGDRTQIAGIVFPDVDVPDLVLDAAKSYVRERLVWASEHSGVTEFIDGAWQMTGTPAVYDNWRIEGLVPYYEEQVLGAYTVSIYQLDYRLHTTTPERVARAEPVEVDSEGWALITYPGSTYLVFLHTGDTMRHAFTTMINDSSPHAALFESDLLAQLEQVVATPTLSEPDLAVSEETLTQLLSTPRMDEKWSDWELVYASSGTLRTLGVLRYTSANGTANLLLGVVDNATRQPVSSTRSLPCDFYDVGFFSSRDGSPTEYILCVGMTFGQGQTESSAATLYAFDGKTISLATSMPDVVMPPEMLAMLRATPNKVATTETRLLLAPGGAELFKRNPAFSLRPSGADVPRWVFDQYVPLGDTHPEARAVETVRRYFEDFYGNVYGAGYLLDDHSADFSIADCVVVEDYVDPDYPDALVYHVNMKSNRGNRIAPAYYFLLDANFNLLGLRSRPDSALEIDGKDYPLGISTRGIFGTPARTNTVVSSDLFSDYAEWFSHDGNNCGYTYYPDGSGRYYLTSICTVREDVYTSRGIHVGSTIAEVIAAYPELSEALRTVPDASGALPDQVSELTYELPSHITLGFQFDAAATREEELTRTVRCIILCAPYWPEV